jgi:hypothetical protein
MSEKTKNHGRSRDLKDDELEIVQPSRRPKVDLDEQDEYDEWRRERGSRGRKRKDKAGGRHRRGREDDAY